MDSLIESRTTVLVYVQAVPKTVPSNAREFSDLSRSDFVLTHSSKSALAKVGRVFPNAKVTAAGYHSILYEALARGAEKAISLPLCDDPLDQARSFPSNEPYPYILVGENPDGIFTGASLCGALSALRKMDFAIMDFAESTVVQGEGVYLVRDDERATHNIDTRLINGALKQVVTPLKALGVSSLGKREQEPNSETLNSESPEEISSSFSRSLRRIVVQ